jgi:hypothetical protein
MPRKSTALEGLSPGMSTFLQGREPPLCALRTPSKTPDVRRSGAYADGSGPAADQGRGIDGGRLRRTSYSRIPSLMEVTEPRRLPAATAPHNESP